jgi:hypothetical protein
MAGRKFDYLDTEKWVELKEILEKYALYCDEVAKHTEQTGPVYTDGYTAVKTGLFALHNMLGKQLGRLHVALPTVVATWDTRRAQKVAEQQKKYDISKSNPTPNEAIKKIEKSRKKKDSE